MILWLILILLTSFPIGYLLAYLTREELVSGRKWIKMLGIFCLILAFIFILISFSLEIKIAVILTLVYIAVVSFVSVYKSYDRKFIR